MAGFDVILLGTGSPLPNPDRCGAGQAVLAGDQRIVIDLGWGAARRLIPAGIPPATVDTVLFTHMHSDHITDVPDFLIMRWAGGATRPLTVYGPTGTRAMIDGFLAGIADDIRFRFAHHGDKLSREGIKTVVHEVAATPARTQIAEIGGCAISSFEVDHFPVAPALGFRVDGHGGSIVFSGDTKRCANLVHAAAGAEVLVSEALHEGMFRMMRERMRTSGANHTASVMDDVPDYHATTIEVAEMARDAAVRKLVLSHLIPPVPNDGPLADAFTGGMAPVFTGEIVMGKDLMRFHVGPE